MILIKNTIVTVSVFYWMPDYQNVLQQFIWQTKDITPELPRVHKFLNYWHHNIDAVIKDVQVAYSEKPGDYRAAEIIKEIKTWQ